MWYSHIHTSVFLHSYTKSVYITNVSVKVIDDHSPILFLICEECLIAIVLFTNAVFNRINNINRIN